MSDMDEYVKKSNEDMMKKFCPLIGWKKCNNRCVHFKGGGIEYVENVSCESFGRIETILTPVAYDPRCMLWHL